ncbi:MAG: hypothetical protein ACE5H6_02625, partial [Dehalococcoidia bacterium]
MYQAILFDAGNTLLHTAVNRRERIRKALASKGLEFAREAVKEAIAQVEGELLGPDKPWVSTEEQEARFWRDYYPRILGALGVSDGGGELA